LFKKIKNPDEMIKLGERRLKTFIKTIGLYNSKAKNIIKLSKILVEKYNSKIPDEFNLLTSLPGVGNKTASVYQNEILNIPRIAVDTHVFRVSNRIGLVKTKNPDDTQEKLESIIPKKWLKSAHHLLILHGRYKCRAQNPFCSECIVLKLCNYENKNEADKKNISSKSQ
jgi:endonuclease-3